MREDELLREGFELLFEAFSIGIREAGQFGDVLVQHDVQSSGLKLLFIVHAGAGGLYVPYPVFQQMS